MLILLDGRWHRVTRVWTRVGGELIGARPSGPDRVVTHPHAELYGGGGCDGIDCPSPQPAIEQERDIAEWWGATMTPDRRRGCGRSVFDLNGWTIWTSGFRWKRAKLVDDRYIDHQTHDSLVDALRAAAGS